MRRSFVLPLLLLLPPGGLAIASPDAPEAEDHYVLAAARLPTPPQIDGRMADGEWAGATAAAGFTQLVPDEGAPASERTELRVGFDRENLYFAVRAWDSEADKLVATILTRDGELDYDDTIRIILDTFHDRQNGFLFATSPTGVQVDALVRNEGEEVNYDWDGVWRCAASRDPEGYVVEIAIPFKTLRFSRAREQVWGLNVERSIPRKQEQSFWKPMSREYGFYARYKISQFGALTGVRDVEQGGRFRFKPYVIGGWNDKNEERRGDWQLAGGFDLKWNVTSQLVADFTYKTDFAEAEADSQEVNLTRFRLFYPEKRDFFLEGASLFFFGDRPEPYRVEVDNIYFFSRQIGLTEDGTRAIPVLGGAKLTGEAGGLSIGMLSLTTDELAYTDGYGRRVVEPRTNFTVLRLKRNVFEKSTIGFLGLNKDPAGAGRNRVVGADWELVLGDRLKSGGYLIRSSTPGLEGDDWAGSADLYWDAKHTRAQIAYTEIGENFNDELGYVPRLGMRKLRADLNLILWPENDRVRNVWFTWDLDYITDSSGNLETRTHVLQANGFFESSAGLSFKFYDKLEVLTHDFEIHKGVVIAPGTYRFRNCFFGFQTDFSKPFGGAGWLAFGDFWDGRFRMTMGGVIYRPLAGLYIFLQHQRYEVKLPAGDFTTDLVKTYVEYSFSSRLSSRVGYQRNQDDNSLVELLLKWTYRPGGDFFLVYKDRRDLTAPGDPFLAGVPGRSILTKTVFTF